MAKKQLKGVIASNKMQNTVIVSVESTKFNQKYRRYYKMHKRFACHVLDSAKYKVGDQVVIEECRPVSKTKKFQVLEK